MIDNSYFTGKDILLIAEGDGSYAYALAITNPDANITATFFDNEMHTRKICKQHKINELQTLDNVTLLFNIDVNDIVSRNCWKVMVTITNHMFHISMIILSPHIFPDT